MKKLLITLLLSSFAMGSSVAFAEPAAAGCEARALTKDGKPLAGAAKAAFLKKCEKGDATDAAGNAANATSGCEARAIGKNGKPLAGAAKAAFLKKCEKEAKAG